MLIRVTAREEPHTPVTAAFQLGDDILAAAARTVRERLAQNHRINLNDALLLFAERAALMISSGAGRDDIIHGLSRIISYDQMIPGAAEMIRSLDLEICGNDANHISIERPVMDGGRHVR